MGHDHKQQQLIGEDVEPSCQVGGNAFPTGTLQLRESDANLDSKIYEGARMRDQDIDDDTSVWVHRRKRQRGRATAVDETEDLSDINDIEVTGYLLKEEEKHYKRIIWEALNRDHSKDKKLQVKPKEATQKKKGRPAKTTKKVEHKRLSSKINYEALEKLTDELIGSPGRDGDVQSRDSSSAMQESHDSKYDEFQQNNELYGVQDGEIYYTGMDAFDNDEYIDFEE